MTQRHAETIAAVRASVAARLAEAGIADPQGEARRLVAAVTGQGVSTEPVRPAQRDRIARLTAARCTRMPLTRCLGRRGFWTLDLAVGPDVLDPRPDTETLVDAALAAGSAPARVLDLGTGSGAILLALLSEWPAARGIGTDRSAAALRVARANAEAAGLDGRCAWLCADWAAPLGGRFDVIVSNPPYVRSAEIAGLAPEVRDHDPWPALDGGPDGLDAYRALIPQAARLLAPGGLVVLETGSTQAAAVSTLLTAAGLGHLAVVRDLAGHDRCVVARCAET